MVYLVKISWRHSVKLVYSILFFLIIACQTTTVKKNNNEISTGWADCDTYTVKVVGANETIAIDKARHKILKDIVNVRVLNGSKYTDITKIKGEFEGPLERGKIIKKQNVPGGLEIFFQIYDKGLKKKFERK